MSNNIINNNFFLDKNHRAILELSEACDKRNDRIIIKKFNQLPVNFQEKLCKYLNLPQEEKSSHIKELLSNEQTRSQTCHQINLVIQKLVAKQFPHTAFTQILTIVDTWVTNSLAQGVGQKELNEAAAEIRTFLLNEQATQLRFISRISTPIKQRLHSLPDIFDREPFISRLNNLICSAHFLQTLPTSIGNLTALKKLDLSDNKLKSLPQGIGNLTALKKLDLSDNKLKSLPQGIGNLTALTKLNLSNNKFESLPPEIGNLSALTNLDINTNAFKSLPLEICNLIALTKLDLSDNKFESLPPEVGNLTALENLNLCQNALTSLPSEIIGNLSALENLNLSNNRLESLPTEIGNLSALKDLNLEENILASLPSEIGNLTALKNLNLAWNILASLPSEIGNLTALEDLNLSNNRLESLPTEIGNLSALENLNLENNEMLTALPSELLDLPYTCEINLTACGLSSQVLRRLQDTVLNPEYLGPRINFSMAPVFQLQMDTIPKISASLATLCSIATLPSKTFPQLMKYLSTNNSKNVLKIWLHRLHDIADFNHHKKTKHNAQFSSKILEYLELANNDEIFQEVFLNIINEAATTCGDRMALSVLQLGLEHRIALECKEECLNFISLSKALRTRCALNLLANIAREKVKRLRFVDEIEVYLAYPIKLQERLNLLIDVKKMHFFNFSYVTEEDLNQAAQHVRDIIDNPISFYQLLIEQDAWQEALQKGSSKEEYQKLLHERTIGLDNEEDAKLLQEQFLQGLLEISKKVLSPLNVIRTEYEMVKESTNTTTIDSFRFKIATLLNNDFDAFTDEEYAELNNYMNALENRRQVLSRNLEI